MLLLLMLHVRLSRHDLISGEERNDVFCAGACQLRRPHLRRSWPPCQTSPRSTVLNGMRMGQLMRCCPLVGPQGSLMGPLGRMGGPEAGAPQAEGPAVAASAWVLRRAPLLVMTGSQVRHHAAAPLL